MERLAKRQANRVVEPETLRRMKSIIDLDLDNENIFLDPKNILVYITNSKVKAFLNEGSISKYPCKNFHEAAYRCYRSALEDIFFVNDFLQITFGSLTFFLT